MFGNREMLSAESREFSTSSRIVVYRHFPGLSNPAIFLFSAKNSAGLFCWSVSPLLLVPLAIDSEDRSQIAAGEGLYFHPIWIRSTFKKPKDMRSIQMRTWSTLWTQHASAIFDNSENFERLKRNTVLSLQTFLLHHAENSKWCKLVLIF